MGALRGGSCQGIYPSLPSEAGVGWGLVGDQTVAWPVLLGHLSAPPHAIPEQPRLFRDRSGTVVPEFMLSVHFLSKDR